MQTITHKLFHSQALSREEAQKLFGHIIRGELDPFLLAALLAALKVRGETPEEIAGAALASLDQALPFPRPDVDFADIVGTGGDGAGTINISTASALVAAAAGFPMIKHGNRSASSPSGSSDLLSALGIPLDKSPQAARQEFDRYGITFLFAPHYHAGFRYAAPVRQALRTRTIFNLLGPLVNPARPPLLLVGVYAEHWMEPVAQTMVLLGFRRAMVVHGSGLDEATLHGPTQVVEVCGGELRRYTLTPQDFGLPTYPLEAFEGGSAEQNRDIITRVFQGHGDVEPQQAIIAANVALVMRLFGREDLRHNAQEALGVMASGRAYELAQRLAGQG